MRHPICHRGAKVGPYDRSQCLVCWRELNEKNKPNPPKPLTPEQIEFMKNTPRRGCCGSNPGDFV